ncbi:hypothetical protein [Sphingomonas bacterium]|uniref:hypothetical protein n=1 Tax=Sphingomonas bacterium TaxID=1895847 RepID=UPI00157522AF|nr:hypothetical protein [Sphingomonas bacterium]
MTTDRVCVVGGLSVVFGIVPILATFAAGAIARAAGCRLDEGDPYACVILGHDWGSALYALGEAFWLALATLWLVPLGLTVLVVGMIRRARRKHR